MRLKQVRKAKLISNMHTTRSECRPSVRPSVTRTVFGRRGLLHKLPYSSGGGESGAQSQLRLNKSYYYCCCYHYVNDRTRGDTPRDRVFLIVLLLLLFAYGRIAGRPFFPGAHYTNRKLIIVHRATSRSLILLDLSAGVWRGELGLPGLVLVVGAEKHRVCETTQCTKGPNVRFVHVSCPWPYEQGVFRWKG